MTQEKQKQLYRDFFDAGMRCNELHPDDDSYDEITFEELFDKHIRENKPTALPNDEEIELEANKRKHFPESIWAYSEGAKWMKEQILK